jgi:hypothetical protein
LANVKTDTRVRAVSLLVLTLMSINLISACSRDVQAFDPRVIEQQYGVAGAYKGVVVTPDGRLSGTVVPVTLADGQKAQLVIPLQASEPHSVYLFDNGGIHPVLVKESARREDVTRSPAVVEKRSEPVHQRKRSWEKEALIIGGSAGAGTAIGALAGRKKGAAVGATAGGIGGLIYDLATRDKN